MIRAVIDTNVLVSGLLSPAGNEALILLTIRQGLVRPCWSGAILTEYQEVLTRPKFPFKPRQVDALLATLRREGEEFAAEGVGIASPDPADSKFLDCAHAAQAEFLVTGNRRHFPDGPYGPTHVVNAGELLDRITRDF